MKIQITMKKTEAVDQIQNLSNIGKDIVEICGYADRKAVIQSKVDEMSNQILKDEAYDTYMTKAIAIHSDTDEDMFILNISINSDYIIDSLGIVHKAIKMLGPVVPMFTMFGSVAKSFVAGMKDTCANFTGKWTTPDQECKYHIEKFMIGKSECYAVFKYDGYQCKLHYTAGTNVDSKLMVQVAKSMYCQTESWFDLDYTQMQVELKKLQTGNRNVTDNIVGYYFDPTGKNCVTFVANVDTMNKSVRLVRSDIYVGKLPGNFSELMIDQVMYNECSDPGLHIIERGDLADLRSRYHGYVKAVITNYDGSQRAIAETEKEEN